MAAASVAKQLNFMVGNDSTLVALVLTLREAEIASNVGVFWTADGTFPPLLEEYLTLKGTATRTDGKTFAEVLAELKAGPEAAVYLINADGVVTLFPPAP